jgi:hypothetical protein
MGFSKPQLQAAIVEWGKSAVEPYDLGLTAIYYGRYREAEMWFTKSIESPETSEQWRLNNRLMCRARVRWELRNYEGAESDLNKLLETNRQSRIARRDLEIVRAAKNKAASPAAFK